MFAGAAPLLLAGLSCGVGFILARLKSRADFSKQVVPEAAIEDSAALDVLFIGHTLLELWLGMIKLRGRYQHEAPGSKTPRSEMYTRHHGASILALALLGYFVWARGLANTPTGQMASAVLATCATGSEPGSLPLALLGLLITAFDSHLSQISRRCHDRLHTRLVLRCYSVCQGDHTAPAVCRSLRLACVVVVMTGLHPQCGRCRRCGCRLRHRRQEGVGRAASERSKPGC